MKGLDIVVVGASAGGVEALCRLVRDLPANFPAAMLIVLHVSATSPSHLPAILARVSKLPVSHASHGEPLKGGHIYVAPPDYHLLVTESAICLFRGPRENRHRPAIDPLFRSAAKHYGARVIGVILTGALDDGTLGMQTIKNAGGTTIVQHPDDALVPDMPLNALRVVEIDHCLPLSSIAGVILDELKKAPKKKPRQLPEKVSSDLAIAESVVPVEGLNELFGPPSGFICPECNGPLWEICSGKALHYRCVVGHSFAPNSLLASESEQLERALWVATKTLEERASLLRHLGTKTSQSRDKKASFDERAAENESLAKMVRTIIGRLVH